MSKPKILVATDFSPQSRAALKVATSFAMIEGAELLIVHVVEDDFEVYLSLGSVSQEAALTALSDALHEITPENPNVSYSHRLLDGKPATAIVDLASSENVEMIVMGTHGRTGFKRMIMGSVAEEVVRNAKCPVLTLRDRLETSKPQATKVV